MKYKEGVDASKQYKETYLNGIYALIEKLQKASLQKRNEFSKDILNNPQKYREELKRILGWPLTENVFRKSVEAQAKCFMKKTD